MAAAGSRRCEIIERADRTHASGWFVDAEVEIEMEIIMGVGPTMYAAERFDSPYDTYAQQLGGSMVTCRDHDRDAKFAGLLVHCTARANG